MAGEKPRGLYVPAGADRNGRRRTVLGGLSIDFKVSRKDADGRFLILEHTDHHPGGPPRHYHHDQEEWFYVLEGDYLLQIGEETFNLKPGDAALAPRMTPHVWAHVGDGTGRLIIAFQPAGSMEAFLDSLSRIEGVPAPEHLHDLFRRHGMEIVGPPLLSPPV